LCLRFHLCLSVCFCFYRYLYCSLRFGFSDVYLYIFFPVSVFVSVSVSVSVAGYVFFSPSFKQRHRLLRKLLTCCRGLSVMEHACQKDFSLQQGGHPAVLVNPQRASARLGSIIGQGDQSGAIGIEGSGDQGLGFWVRVKGDSSIHVQPKRVLTARSEGSRWRSCSTSKRTERLKKKKRKSLGNSWLFINRVISRFSFNKTREKEG